MHSIHLTQEKKGFVYCNLYDSSKQNNRLRLEDVTIDYCISYCHYHGITISNAQQILFQLHAAGNTFTRL